MKLMKEEIPHLNIEVLPGGIIRLENESMGDNYVVDVHPVHLRLMVEKMGLVREVSASAPELLRDLGRYKRALMMLRDRAEQLHQNILGLSQLGHEDLGIEVAQSAALADITDHICIEFEDDFTPEPTLLANLPKTRGAFATQCELSGSACSVGTREHAMRKAIKVPIRGEAA